MTPAEDAPPRGATGMLRLPKGSPVPALPRRTALAVGIILVVAVGLWFDRDGLRDTAHPDRPLGFSDVFYFTVVSLTTVGYGDIVAVTDASRLVNAIVLTPVRVFLWALFLGTAHELSVLRLRLREEYQLRQLHERLDGHAVVCGFGSTGRAAVGELLAHGRENDQIVVIDRDEAAVAAAVDQGLAALRGDASAEATLQAAAVERAETVLVATGRDDACVLVCLTARNLSPRVHLVAFCQEEENVKLLYGAGANTVVSPAVSGGRLMASSVRQQAVPRFLEDILAFGGALGAAERPVRPEEAGRRTADLPDLPDALVVGVDRAGQRVPFDRLADFPLQPGDVVVYLTAGPARAPGAQLPVAPVPTAPRHRTPARTP